MKKYYVLLILFVSLTSFNATNNNSSNCDIVGFYIAQDVDSGTKAIDEWGDFVEIEKVLIPYSDIEEGTYEVSITKKDDNLYNIDQTDIYIETSLCLELAFMSDAILRVQKYIGRPFGEIIFLE